MQLQTQNTRLKNNKGITLQKIIDKLDFVS